MLLFSKVKDFANMKLLKIIFDLCFSMSFIFYKAEFFAFFDMIMDKWKSVSHIKTSAFLKNVDVIYKM